MAKVLGWVSLMLTIDLDRLIDIVSGTIQCDSLAWITDSVVFRIFAAIHLDK